MQLVPAFSAYLRMNSVWGSLHIVMGDLNFDESCVRYCITVAAESKDIPGLLLGNVLLLMTQRQREMLLDASEEALMAGGAG